MKTMNFCTEKSGYYYNPTSKKLEAYDLVCIVADFKSQTVLYHCHLGGTDQEKVIENLNLKLYKTEEDFRDGTILPMKSLAFEEVFFYAKGFRPHKRNDEDTEWYAWCWHWGDGAIEMNVSDSVFCYEPIVDGWELDNGYFLYETYKDIYLHHDYTVKLSDGTEVVRKSPQTLLTLSSEQREVMKRISSLLNKASEIGIQIMADDCKNLLYAFPKDSVDKYGVNEYNFDLNKEGINGMNLVESFSSGNMWSCGCIESIDLVLKKEDVSE